MTGEEQARRQVQRGARDDVVAETHYLERPDLAQRRLDEIGDLAFVVAHRPNRHEFGRALEKALGARPFHAGRLARQTETPWSRSTALSAALSWRSPSSSRRSTKT